jgi:hypothetical protein
MVLRCPGATVRSFITPQPILEIPMARALIAHLKREDVPTRKALQQAIDKLAFPLTLDHGYVPFETSGYLPCTLDGEDAGFDLRFGEFRADPGASKIGERDTALWCKWSGDPREEASALIVCAALAAGSHALVQRDGEAFLSVDELLRQAKAALA